MTKEEVVRQLKDMNCRNCKHILFHTPGCNYSSFCGRNSHVNDHIITLEELPAKNYCEYWEISDDS